MRVILALLMLATPSVMAATVVPSEEFPVGETTIVSDTYGTLYITDGGAPSGYHLYTSPSGSRSTIDSRGDTCVVVDASYTIIRGLNIGGSSGDCVAISPSVTNTVIEGNHIGAVPWGSANYDRGISLASSGIENVVIQRNVIDNPRQDATTWADGHPAGQYAIRIIGSGISGVVIRYNNIGSANGNRLHDAISAADSEGCDGMEIYGNLIVGVTDNGVEAEAACREARITGNRFNQVYRPIATAGPVVGPVLIARNVIGPDFVYSGGSHFAAPFKFKDADNLLVYHNTILHGGSPSADDLSDGGSGAFGRNNVIHVDDQAVKAGNWDFDLYQGSITSGNEANGINAAASYDGLYLADGSPGVDAGVVLLGYNEDYLGAGPDMGAFERGAPPLEFGVDAYLGNPPNSPVCGDGIRDVTEACDGGSFGGKTCSGLGLGEGLLSCSSTCQFVTDGCIQAAPSACGNGVRDPGEDCDGTDIGGWTCESIGFANGGVLACGPNCTFDTGLCAAECDVCPPAPVCDPVPQITYLCEPGYRAACVEVLQ